jgi:hypothetical protein
MQNLRNRLLRHQLAIQKHPILETIRDPGIDFCPGDKLLNSAMPAAQDLSWTVVKRNRPPTDGNVLPHTVLHRAQDPSATLAFGTQTTIFVRLDPQTQFLISEPKLKIGDR